MEARYTIRKAQLLEECQVAPEIFHAGHAPLGNLYGTLCRHLQPAKPLGRTP